MRKPSNDSAFTRDDLHGTRPEPSFAGALSFLRRNYTRDLTGVDIVVTGVPFDTATTNRSGTRLGPRAIRAASAVMAWERRYGMEVRDDCPSRALRAGNDFAAARWIVQSISSAIGSPLRFLNLTRTWTWGTG